jgi:3-oxoadipate enol-lactonase
MSVWDVLETGEVEVNGAHIAYDRAGDGPPLLLLHAGCANREMWDAQIDDFAEQYQLLIPDLRGFGDSTIPEQPYSLHADIAAFLETLGVERAAIVGCSLGAAGALDLAIARPDLVAALVLLSPGLSGYVAYSEQLIGRYGEIGAALQAGDPERAIALELPLVAEGMRSKKAIDPELRADIEEMLAATYPNRPLIGQMEPLDPPAAGRLAEVQARTLVVSGQYDIPDMLAVAEVIVSGCSIFARWAASPITT